MKFWLVLAAALSLACSSLPTVPRNALSPEVTVSDRNGWIILEPSSVPAKRTGLVFYPGGLVNPDAYLKALSPLAAAGWTVAIPKMPFDLAFFDAEKGLKVRQTVPSVDQWIVGGHSLGGVAAALAVKKSPTFFIGVVFLASYPADSADLSGLAIPVLSISGSNDGLATPAKVTAGDRFLPVGTEHHQIGGANHAQFADYGPQKGDGQAELPREEQQGQVVEWLRIFLEKRDGTF